MSNQDLNDVTQGARFDEGKDQMELVPMTAMRAIAKVLGKGAEKYTKYNWLKGMQHTQLYASCMRHLASWLDGEDIDKESGMPHIWHALTNLAMLADHLEHGRGEDDRYKHTLEGWKKEREAAAKEFEPIWAPNIVLRNDGCHNCAFEDTCSGQGPGYGCEEWILRNPECDPSS